MRFSFILLGTLFALATASPSPQETDEELDALRRKWHCHNVVGPHIDDYVQCDACRCDDNDGIGCRNDCVSDWGNSQCCKACCHKCHHGGDGTPIC